MKHGAKCDLEWWMQSYQAIWHRNWEVIQHHACPTRKGTDHTRAPCSHKMSAFEIDDSEQHSYLPNGQHAPSIQQPKSVTRPTISTLLLFWSYTRWFKYDGDWSVCKQAALRSSCATLREEPPAPQLLLGLEPVQSCLGVARVMGEQKVLWRVEQRIMIKLLVGENVLATEIHQTPATVWGRVSLTDPFVWVV
jgi:hypothetical protein